MECCFARQGSRNVHGGTGQFWKRAPKNWDRRALIVGSEWCTLATNKLVNGWSSQVQISKALFPESMQCSPLPSRLEQVICCSCCLPCYCCNLFTKVSSVLVVSGQHTFVWKVISSTIVTFGTLNIIYEFISMTESPKVMDDLASDPKNCEDEECRIGSISSLHK
jgi:hypothetical protein